MQNINASNVEAVHTDDHGITNPVYSNLKKSFIPLEDGNPPIHSVQQPAPTWERNHELAEMDSCLPV